MKVYTLKKEQKISKNILEVFEFFSRPENLATITPPKMNFNILGFPVRWRTLITKYDPPNIFVDQQLKGPYSLWHHTHTFKKINEKETLILDVVVYSIPFSFIGSLVHSVYIKKDLDKIFSFRAEKIKEIFND